MSAYVVDPEHVKVLAIWATQSRPRLGIRVHQNHVLSTDQPMRDEDLASAYADMLWQENIRSVMARYPNDTFESLPGPIEKPEHIVITECDYWATRPAFQSVQILKMLECLEYQSCETRDYQTTPAYRLLDHMRRVAISELPGYEDAPWEYTGPESLKGDSSDIDFVASYRAFCD